MKILILTTKSNWGGAQRYVYDLATGLPKDEYEIEVLAGGNGILIEKLKAAGISADGNLPIGRDISLGEDFKAFVSLVRILWRKKPDILHLNSSKIGGLGALAGRLTRIRKIIFTAHGWAFNERRTFFSKMVFKCAYWATLMLSHETIAVSEAVRHEIRNWPFVYKKIKVVRNGLRSSVLYTKTSARQELSNIHPGLKNLLDLSSTKNIKDITWVGTVAELHHVKGHEDAIRGFHGLLRLLKAKNPASEAVYVIIGSGEEEEYLAGLASKLGLENNVFFLGYLDNASIYMKAFDIFILASLSEALGFVLLEAGLAQLPVIATTVGGIPEVIDDMKSGILIQPQKPVEITHALDFLVQHKNVRKKYGEILQEKIKRDYTLEKMLEDTVKIYTGKAI